MEGMISVRRVLCEPVQHVKRFSVDTWPGNRVWQQKRLHLNAVEATRQTSGGSGIRYKARGGRDGTFERRNTSGDGRYESLQILAVGASDVVVDGSVNGRLAILGSVGIWHDEGALHESGNLERDQAQDTHADIDVVASLHEEWVHAGGKRRENANGDVEDCVASKGFGVGFADGEDANCWRLLAMAVFGARGSQLEFPDMVLFATLYFARVFGPACALASEHTAAKAAK